MSVLTRFASRHIASITHHRVRDRLRVYLTIHKMDEPVLVHRVALEEVIDCSWLGQGVAPGGWELLWGAPVRAPLAA